jgi:hypothetical protein
MQKYIFIALFLVSTIGFIPAYRKFELNIRGRIFILLLAGMLIFVFNIILVSTSISLYALTSGEANESLIDFLTFNYDIWSKHPQPLLFISYLCFIWAFLGAVTNRILKSEKFNPG